MGGKPRKKPSAAKTYHGLLTCPKCFGWSYNPCTFCGHNRRGIGKTQAAVK